MAQLQNAKAKKKKGGNVNRRNVWLLVASTILVIGSIFMFTPPQEKINQGLDIQGGLSVVLSAKSTDGGTVSTDDMEKSRAIIEQRVNALGASEAVVQLQGTDQILVQSPACPTPKRRCPPSAKPASLSSHAWIRSPIPT